MARLYANNASSTLASNISAAATSLTVQTADAALFPTPSGADVFYATLENAAGLIEIVKCTARTSAVLTVVRGQESTTASAYVAGDRVELRFTAGLLEELIQSGDNVVLGSIAASGHVTPGADSTYNLGASGNEWANAFVDALTVGSITVSGNVDGRDISADGTALDAAVIDVAAAIADNIPAGTKMLFMQNAAPTGWTFVSANNDSVILNTSTVGEGGDAAGSWTITGLTGGTTGSTTLTEAQIPAHTHTVAVSNQNGATGIIDLRQGVTGSTVTTNSTGGGTGHTHTGDTPVSDGLWRPAYVKCITCSKD